MAYYSQASGSSYPQSYEPTESGFDEMPEDHERESKAILAADSYQLAMFQAIQAIDSHALQPSGSLPERKDPTTHRYKWQRRTPESITPEVWCRKTTSGTAVAFEVVFLNKEFVTAYVPTDSWRNATCDAEAVRATIQQAYLNLTRGVSYHRSVVAPGMKSLKLRSNMQYKATPRHQRPKPIPVPDFAKYQDESDARFSSGSKSPVYYPGHSPRSPAYQNNLHTSTPNYIYPSQQLTNVRQYNVVYPHQRRASGSDLYSSTSSRTTVDPTYGAIYYDPHRSSPGMAQARHYVGPPPPRAAERHNSALLDPRHSDRTMRGTPRHVRRNSGWSRFLTWI